MAKKSNFNYSSKRDNVERLKEQARAASSAKKAETQWQELLSQMTEEEAKAFVSQVDVIARERALNDQQDQLDKAREELDGMEKDLDVRNETLLDRESTLDQREQAVKDREDAAAVKDTAYRKKDSELINRERSIVERETNAEAGFARQNRKALESLNAEKEALAAELRNLEVQKAGAEKQVNEEIADLRAKKLAALDAELQGTRKGCLAAAQKEAAQIVDAAKEAAGIQHAQLSREREELNALSSELEHQRRDQEKREQQLREGEEDLAADQADLKSERDRIPEQVKAKMDERTRAIQFEREQAIKTSDSYQRRLRECEQELDVYKGQEREAGGMTMAELLEKLNFEKAENKRLSDQLAAMPDQALHAEYRAKAEKYDELDRQYVQLAEEKAELALEKEHWLIPVKQMEWERERFLLAEKNREVLQASIAQYTEEVNRLKSLYEQPKELAGRLESIETPYFKRMAMAVQVPSETAWLDRILTDCEQAGIRFNQRLLYSFHTALKTADWSPITVLAGVSGTGKSLLPEYYCRFGGIYFMSMAVQPDWDSPQSLFGYFNSVDNRFNATTLIRAMVQFSSHGNDTAKRESDLSDSMFIVLLDEMNLAHVELYFSDMLSKLERRRNSDDEIDIEIDLGAGMKKYPLELNDNTLWVGTMNEDETTKSLSDKVLDRGILLSFPRPKEFISRVKGGSVEAAPMLPKSTWRKWVNDNVMEVEAFRTRIGRYKKGLEAVNEAMEFAGRALGHRVWQSIENYMANHPKVIAAVNAEPFDPAVCDLAMQKAFEEALVHKVMPKLRGIELDGRTKTQCFDKIEATLFGTNGKGGLAPGLLADFQHAKENAYETFIWSSAQYLEAEE